MSIKTTFESFFATTQRITRNPAVPEIGKQAIADLRSVLGAHVAEFESLNVRLTALEIVTTIQRDEIKSLTEQLKCQTRP